MNDQKSDWGPLFWGIVWSAFVLLVAGKGIYDGHGQWFAWLGAVFILLLMGPPYFFIVLCCCFPALCDKYNKQIAVVFGIWMVLLVIGPLLIFWPIILVMALVGGSSWSGRKERKTLRECYQAGQASSILNCAALDRPRSHSKFVSSEQAEARTKTSEVALSGSPLSL